MEIYEWNFSDNYGIKCCISELTKLKLTFKNEQKYGKYSFRSIDHLKVI